MQEVKTYFEAIKLLNEHKVLAFKPLKGQITLLTLVKNDRIAVFNENLRYNISFDDLNELKKENKIFIYDKEDIGIE